jgi:tellurite resistance protein TerC
MDLPLLPLLFGVFVVGALALDLGLLRRRGDHQIKPREALTWTGLWVSLALAFGLLVFLTRDGETAVAYLTAYLVEWSLSLDNVFVIALIFTTFSIPPRYQHRALVLGVLGALVMRFGLILAGTTLVERFDWLLPVFGAFLVVTGIRMARGGHGEGHGEEPALIRFLRARLPITDGLRGERFTVVEAGKRYLTPLGLALISIEAMDLVFAVDSIPAALAISPDPFVIYTSNAFAILGLRSLYFLLAEARERFSLLAYGLAATLLFIGLKLIAGPLLDLHLPPALSLGAVVLFIGGSVALSLLRSRR